MLIDWSLFFILLLLRYRCNVPYLKSFMEDIGWYEIMGGIKGHLRGEADHFPYLLYFEGDLNRVTLVVQ